MTNQDYNLGHRKRLRQKLLDSNIGQLPDYELLELLLCFSQPRRDMKPLAKELLAKYGSFSEVISATKEELLQTSGVGESIIASFRLIQDSVTRMLKDNVVTKPILDSWHNLINYVKASMAHLKIEQFRILYLDKKNMILDDEIKQDGTIDYVSIYPREILKKALLLGATSLILVHNHPSGNLKPSKADIELTKHIKASAEAIGILVHDHIIVASSGYYSFKEHKLI